MSHIHRSAAIAGGRLRQFVVLALFALLGLGAALQAHAQAPAGDPPDRVARLSDASGQVWLFNQDDNEWVAVDRNRPLTTGDRIATDNDAHAEITLGTTTLRLDGATELEIVQLDDRTYRVHLHGGSAVARLRSAQSLAEFALETDEGLFRVQAVGRYRFDHFDQASDLTVYNGQAVFEGRNSALPLATGQHAQFWLDASGAPQYNMLEPARDAFAAWNDERERAENRPVAAVRYVSPEMTGSDDLDRYGQWEQSPDYGPLWTPANVAVDWAPYSAGHWAWVRPWGWTWVDAAPWGFAPFHYGRWVNYRNRWCWAPGTYVARPVYAPALVAWIGGPRVGVSIGVGARRAAGGLVPARAARGLRAELPHQPALRARDQHHARHQRHQHHDDRQQRERRGRSARVRQPPISERRDGGAGRRAHGASAGRPRRRPVPKRSAGSRARLRCAAGSGHGHGTGGHAARPGPPAGGPATEPAAIPGPGAGRARGSARWPGRAADGRRVAPGDAAGRASQWLAGCAR